MHTIDGGKMGRQIAITECRRHLGSIVRKVEHGDGPQVIVAHGKPRAALISMEQLRMLWMAEDELHQGPIDFNTGRRPGSIRWARIRRWLSNDKETYVTESEQAYLAQADEDARWLKKWREGKMKEGTSSDGRR